MRLSDVEGEHGGVDVSVQYMPYDVHNPARIDLRIAEVGGVDAYARLTPQQAKAIAHALLTEADRATKELGWR